MNHTRTLTEIILNVNTRKTPNRKENIKAISKAIYSHCREQTEVEIMLGYIIEHCASGFYRTLKNSRKLCCQRLGFSVDKYDKCIRELVASGVIKKYENANGSTWAIYELSPTLKKMVDAKGVLHLTLKTNIAI